MLKTIAKCKIKIQNFAPSEKTLQLYFICLNIKSQALMII